MADKNVSGSCLCGEIEYEFSGNIGVFQYCHCSRCRKFTGSAHAANIFVSIDQFKWCKGEALVKDFQPQDTKHFATAFCSTCGSSMPWKSKTADIMIVPAGTLDEHPHIEPTQNIFYDSKAEWYCSASDLPEYAELPNKKA